MNTALAKTESNAALTRPFDDDPLSIDRLIARVDKIKEAQRRAMHEGQHFGKVPGVDKPTLLKPGAELLGMMFQLAASFRAADHWNGEHLECVVTCTLTHSPTGVIVGEGLGSCTTRESRYAWRKGERLCPNCNEPAIIKGKQQYGGGWLCWNKPEKNKNGCGAKFEDGDESIELQTVDRVPNPDLADQYNTVRKMACKRAHVAAILFVTCASEIFTQDVEDLKGKDDDRDARPSNGGQKSIPQDGDKHSAEVTAKLLRQCSEASDSDGVTDIEYELQQLKNERELSRADVKKVADALAARRASLKGAA